MRTIATTLVAMVVLVAVGSVLGLTSNALRKDGIKLSKSHFAKPKVTKPVETPADPTDDSDPPEVNLAKVDEPDGGTANPPPGDHPEHIFQVISLEEVADLAHDPLYPGELCVFIDSRGDEAYEVGHIPYARQMNPYHSERYLPQILPEVLAAEKVVVYCEGGQCDDSIFACRELLDNGVSFESIYLFEGGMEAWEEADGPIDEGRD